MDWKKYREKNEREQSFFTKLEISLTEGDAILPRCMLLDSIL